MAAMGLVLALSGGGRLWAKGDPTFDETLKWVEKHRDDLRAEWHTTEGPTKWQPEDFKNYSGMQDWFWDRTIKWTAKSECPHFNKALESDGESYSITRAVAFTGLETDISEQPSTKDASYTKLVEARYTWRVKVSQVVPDPVIMDYKEYLQRTNQTDNRSVDVGAYYYVCIMPKSDANQDAIIEIGDDQRVDDGRGNITTTKGHKQPVSMAGIATVYDKKMAERLANAVGHLIRLLQNQEHPKEAF